MMNAVRYEPFTVGLSFEGDTDIMADFCLQIAQGGRVRLTRGMREAEFLDEEHACVTFSGCETARLCPLDPAWAQVTALLKDGTMLHSEAQQINVVDVLPPGQEEKYGMP